LQATYLRKSLSRNPATPQVQHLLRPWTKEYSHLSLLWPLNLLSLKCRPPPSLRNSLRKQRNTGLGIR